MKEKILNRYEVLHKQLDEGKTPSEIIKSELSCVFPELDEKKSDKIVFGLIEAGIAYAAKSGKISEISNAANLWQGKLSSMEEEERLASIHSYRLLHDLMTEDNIRLASEGKRVTVGAKMLSAWKLNSPTVSLFPLRLQSI